MCNSFHLHNIPRGEYYRHPHFTEKKLRYRDVQWLAQHLTAEAGGAGIQTQAVWTRPRTPLCVTWPKWKQPMWVQPANPFESYVGIRRSMCG